MVAAFSRKIAAAALILPALGPITACSTQSASVPSSPAVVTEYESANVGTSGALIPIESSNVNMAGYDATNRVMTVLFDSGGLYEYFDVPPTLWEDFLDAQPSPWSLVGYPQLVQGGYPYQRIS